MAELSAPSEPSLPQQRLQPEGPAKRDRAAWVNRRRRLVPVLLLALLLLIVVPIAAWQGVVRPVRIVGGSMADALYGAHYSVRCADCGIEFSCGLEFPPVDQLAVCPNCGYSRNHVEGAVLVPGQRVLINHSAIWFRPPQLWQVVAYSSSTDADFLAVKRIVAGGGGGVEIRHGDVLVDGQIQRKSLAQLRELCILVHDDHFRPSRDPTLPSRWQGTSSNSRWHRTRSGYEFTAGAAESESDVEWLEYQQWICWPNAAPPAPRTTPTLIFDHDGYNQSLPRGALQHVTDLLLQCRATLHGTGRLLLQIKANADSFQLELTGSPNGCRLIHNGETIWQLQDLGQSQPWNLEMAVCDQQVLCAVNGAVLPPFVFQPTASRQAALVPLAIGAAGVDLQLEAPRIYRDLHYLGPGGQPCWKLTEPLGPHQWFVLGDNVPISIDSRRHGPIHRDAILGAIYPLPWVRKDKHR